MQENINLINFKKERNLGEILSDTFAFIRQNYKSLFKIIYKVVGPILLLTLISYSVYLVVVLKGTGNFLSPDIEENIDNLTSRYAMTFLMGMIFMIVVSVLFYSLFYATLNYSVQSYIENKGKIDEEEVAKKIKYNWSSFFKLAFLSGVFVVLGFFLFFIPGVYIAVPLSLVFSIMIFHEMGVMESISYSFKLIKNNWWMSFFTLFLMLLIYYTASSVFQMPAAIYSLFNTMVSAQSEDGISFTNIYDWPYLILNFLGTMAQFVLYGFVIISTIFLFFSLNEKLNKTGAFETIENLGENH